MTVNRQRRAPSSHAPRITTFPGVRRRGFSAVELLVVLAIAGILVTLAVPSFQSLIQSNRVSSELSTLMGDLQFARAEALRTGQFVSICTSSNGSSCNLTTGDWRGGWILFSDATGNRVVDSATGDTVLRVRQPFNPSDTLQTNPVTNAIAFNRTGFASGLNQSVLLRGSATATGSPAIRCMLINVVGRLQIQTPAANPGSCQ